MARGVSSASWEHGWVRMGGLAGGPWGPESGWGSWCVRVGALLERSLHRGQSVRMMMGRMETDRPQTSFWAQPLHESRGRACPWRC